MTLHSVPDPEPIEVYGYIDFHDGLGETGVRRLTIGVCYGITLEDLQACPEDVVLDHTGEVLRHPYGALPRKSTEEERAAVGWTW